MKNKIIKKFEILTISLTIILLVFIFTLEMVNLKNVIQGVAVGTEKIGGLNSQELRNVLISKSKNQKDIIIQSKNNKWKISPKNLGISININDTIISAFSIGREKNIFFGIKLK